MLVQACLSVQQVCVWVTRVIAVVNCYLLVFAFVWTLRMVL